MYSQAHIPMTPNTMQGSAAAVRRVIDWVKRMRRVRVRRACSRHHLSAIDVNVLPGDIPAELLRGEEQKGTHAIARRA
jgi:hypothetical protein